MYAYTHKFCYSMSHAIFVGITDHGSSADQEIVGMNNDNGSKGERKKSHAYLLGFSVPFPI
jgi:hypothetical protein